MPGEILLVMSLCAAEKQSQVRLRGAAIEADYQQKLCSAVRTSNLSAAWFARMSSQAFGGLQRQAQ
jgi:hypothetical protein